MRALPLLLAALVLPAVASAHDGAALQLRAIHHAWSPLDAAEIWQVTVENEAFIDATRLQAWIWPAAGILREEIPLDGSIPPGGTMVFRFRVEGAPMAEPCLVVFGRDVTSHEECVLTEGLILPKVP